jgi:hypothetical protein
MFGFFWHFFVLLSFQAVKVGQEINRLTNFLYQISTHPLFPKKGL